MIVLIYIAAIIAIINVWVITAGLAAVTRDWHPIRKLVKKIKDYFTGDTKDYDF